MSKAFYPRLAAQNIIKNGKFYFPYILTVIFTAASFYICVSLSYTPDLPDLLRYQYLTAYMTFGCFVLGLFIFIFLIYTNSFLMKRRVKELGLYNVLGMGKRSIGVVLSFESLYIWIIGAGAGIGFGIVFQKLIMMLAQRLMRIDIAFAFYISPTAIVYTVLFFGGVLLITLIKNLWRLQVQKPVELLRGGSVGEREPKTRWLLALLGILSLGGGYYIAVTTRDVMTAFALYFVAVFLVIIGTYCLFCAVSIAVLKVLRKNKGFYYKTGNFIGVSGMLHRMNRNAVGLANICILSTMVLVMISGTLSLYMGTENILDRSSPASLNIAMRMAGRDRLDTQRAEELFIGAAERCGLNVTKHAGGTSLTKYMMKDGANYNDRYNGETGAIYVTFMTAEDFTRLTDCPLELKPEQAAVLSGLSGEELSLEFVDAETGQVRSLSFETVPVQADWRKGYLSEVPGSGGQEEIIVLSAEGYERVREYTLLTSGRYYTEQWRFYIDTDASEEQQAECADKISSKDFVGFEPEEIENIEYFRVQTRSQDSADAYSTNGGFLFLGVFLGLIFIIAMVLIMYYKQISEGYEDRQRFAIMQQVGLEKRDIRRSINMQVLIVFFAPLIVAGIHVAFDFILMTKLLMLFSMYNTRVTAVCTLAVFTGFALLYAAVYALTAKTYYNIVSERD